MCHSYVGSIMRGYSFLYPVTSNPIVLFPTFLNHTSTFTLSPPISCQAMGALKMKYPLCDESLNLNVPPFCISASLLYLSLILPGSPYGSIIYTLRAMPPPLASYITSIPSHRLSYLTSLNESAPLTRILLLALFASSTVTGLTLFAPTNSSIKAYPIPTI